LEAHRLSIPLYLHGTQKPQTEDAFHVLFLLDMVRCGIALYGLRPSAEVEPAIPSKPAMALKSRVARVRTLPPGSSISYGCTYTTTRPTPVALVPVGYGDGYHRLLSNKGSVLIGGKRAPIVGRVCMDQFVVDVTGHFDPSTSSGRRKLRTGIEGVRRDDEVVVFDRQGGEEISAEEVAALVGTINYEVVTSILPRVTRVYLKGGQVVEVRPLVEDGD
jgi:alanine racemase